MKGRLSHGPYPFPIRFEIEPRDVNSHPGLVMYMLDQPLEIAVVAGQLRRPVWAMSGAFSVAWNLDEIEALRQY